MSKLKKLLPAMLVVVMVLVMLVGCTTPNNPNDNGSGENVTPPAPATITGIEITTPATKVSFKNNEEFSYDGLVVSKVMSDNTKVALQANEITVTCADYNKLVAGTYTVTITLKADTTKTVTYNVVVGEAYKTDTVISYVAKDSFVVGEKFAKGIIVSDKMSDGKFVTLPATEYTVDSKLFKKDVVGRYPITVTLKDEAKTKLTYEVEVKEKAGDVYFTTEALVLGGGYLVEPVKVAFAEGDSYSDVILRALLNVGYGVDFQTSWGFYLAAIYDGSVKTSMIPGTNTSSNANIYVVNDNPNIPTEMFKGAYADLSYNTFVNYGNKNYGDPQNFGGVKYAAGLGGGSYQEYAGWMMSVNNVFPSVGTDGVIPKDGDVARLQFSLTMGTDIGTDYMNPEVKPVNKTDLIKKMVDVKSEKAYYLTRYDDAMDVLTNPVATQEEVDLALQGLQKVTGVKVLQPGKVEFENGEAFDKTGMYVVAVYADGSMQVLDNSKSDYTVKNYDKFKAGLQELEVTIWGTNITCKYPVTVKEDYVESITALVPNTSYIVGENFVPERIVAEKVMHSKKILPLTADEIIVDSSKYNNTVAGKYSISVKLKADEAKTCAFDVVVKEKIGTVTFAIEVLQLNEVIVEPILVPIGKDDNVVNVLFRALDLAGYGATYSVSSTGDFFLIAIFDGQSKIVYAEDDKQKNAVYEYKYLGSNPGLINIKNDKPAVVDGLADYDDIGFLDMLFMTKASDSYGTTRSAGGTDYATAIGTNSYGVADAMGGWMFTVNNEMAPYYAQDVVLKANDVIRFQFSLCLAGSSIGYGFEGDAMFESWFAVANKDALATKIATIKAENKVNEYGDSYVNAVKAYKNLFATQEQVDTALANLVPAQQEQQAA